MSTKMIEIKQKRIKLKCYYKRHYEKKQKLFLQTNFIEIYI